MQNSFFTYFETLYDSLFEIKSIFDFSDKKFLHRVVITLINLIKVILIITIEPIVGRIENKNYPMIIAFPT